MALEPTDQQLLEFIDAMLSNLDREMRDPEVLAESLRERREMWVDLYRVSHWVEDSDPER